MTMQQIAEKIPHNYRQQILLEWIPAAKANLQNEAFRLLWEAYFIYIDPDGIKKTDCPICLNNVLKNWKALQPYLKEAEQAYNELEAL